MRTCRTWVPGGSLGALQKCPSFPLSTKPACVETELLQGERTHWAPPVQPILTSGCLLLPINLFLSHRWLLRTPHLSPFSCPALKKSHP